MYDLTSQASVLMPNRGFSEWSLKSDEDALIVLRSKGLHFLLLTCSFTISIMKKTPSSMLTHIKLHRVFIYINVNEKYQLLSCCCVCCYILRSSAILLMLGTIYRTFYKHCQLCGQCVFFKKLHIKVSTAFVAEKQIDHINCKLVHSPAAG